MNRRKFLSGVASGAALAAVGKLPLPEASVVKYPAVIAQGFAISTGWDCASTSTPLADIRAMQKRLRQYAIDDPVIVVANFSDWGTSDPLNPASRYDVPNWPGTPVGKTWREITQGYVVGDGMAGHEALFPWEAKVYALG